MNHFVPPLRKQLRRQSDRGQVLVMVVLAMTALLLMAGLGVDVGYLRYQKLQMQKAADAGAIAGAATRLYSAEGSTAITTAARNDASGNGFANGANGIGVAVNNPPAGGIHSGDGNYVEVIVSQPQPTFFMHVGGFGNVPVSARSVGAIGSSSGCIYVLDPIDNATLTVSGSGVLTSQCGVLVRSSGAGYDVSGGACVTAPNVELVGSVDQNACTKPQAPQTGVVPFNDPLASLPAPTFSCPASPPSIPTGCNYSKSGGLVCNSHPVPDIQAGTYCGGITIQASAGSATFDAGTYILAGGGLTASGGASISGSGVTFYNTTDPSNQAGYKPIVVSGGSTTSLIAPTTGAYPGILFFQDRNLPSTDLNQQNTISGGSSAFFEGALYFPTTPLVYSGGGSTSSPYAIIVAWTLTVSGPSNFNNNYAALPDGSSPIHSAVLAE